MPAGSGGSAGPSEARASAAVGSEARGGEEDSSDPFGLEAMMGAGVGMGMGMGADRKRTKREEREKRRREEEEAVRKEEEEERQLLRERREALLQCVQTAAEMYKHKW